LSSNDGGAMAAPTTMLGARLRCLDFWDRFRNELEHQVQECNAVAGETLWKITSTTSSPLQLTIQCSTLPEHRLDCSFSSEQLTVRCTRGPNEPAVGHEFQWVGGTAPVLRRGVDEFTLSEALNLILDQLAWPDD
jgi:hypothetical protein